MGYQLQKLNVSKTVERADQRDALLAKGFVEIKEKKVTEKKADEKPPKDDAK